jgi:hypothetical protein
MSFQYFVINPDGRASVRDCLSLGQFVLTDCDAAVGVGYAARVGLNPAWMMTGYVNDCGLLPTLDLERNVVGGVLLGVLGGSEQPYAGPVVVCGWDERATSLGQVEVESLMSPHVDVLNEMVADIRIVLGMDEGTPSHSDPVWAADVRMFAEYILNHEAEPMRVVSGDDAVEHLAAALRRREDADASRDCRRDEHGTCPQPGCACPCHVGEEYVPVRGWLPAAQAQADRSAYLDEDAAIERAYERQGDM